MIALKNIRHIDSISTTGNLLTCFKKFVNMTHTMPIYIAGGFVRDMIYGKPFKDIDIHIPFGGASAEIVQIFVDNAFGCKTELELYPEAEFLKMYEGIGEINSVYRLKGCIVPIDIIVYNTPKLTPQYILSRFDLSICQAVITNNTIAGFEVFYNDSDIVTYNKDRKLKPERVARLKDKYPEFDWGYVDGFLAKQQLKNAAIPPLGDVVKKHKELFVLWDGVELNRNVEF